MAKSLAPRHRGRVKSLAWPGKTVTCTLIHSGREEPMTRNHESFRPCSFVAITLMTTLLGFAAPAWSATPNCRSYAKALRESLEVVVEAVVDGRTAEVPGAAERAAAWWRTHHQALRHGPEAARLMDAMVASARKGDSREAAHSAIRGGVESFKWCPGKPRTDDQLMLLDFVGMTGWLRAHGASVDWPPGVEAATDSLARQLAARGKAALATQLRSAIRDTIATTANGDVKPSLRLLDYVDV